MPNDEPQCISFNNTTVKTLNQFQIAKLKQKKWIKVMIDKRNSPQSPLGRRHLKGMGIL